MAGANSSVIAKTSSWHKVGNLDDVEYIVLAT